MLGKDNDVDFTTESSLSSSLTRWFQNVKQINDDFQFIESIYYFRKFELSMILDLKSMKVGLKEVGISSSDLYQIQATFPNLSNVSNTNITSG